MEEEERVEMEVELEEGGWVGWGWVRGRLGGRGLDFGVWDMGWWGWVCRGSLKNHASSLE